MYSKLRGGDDLKRLYRNRRAVDEIVAAYEIAKRSGRSEHATVEAMTRVIQMQVSHNEFISLHLRGEAVDVRVRDMSPKQQQVCEDIVRRAGLPAPIHEHTPEHLHLQFR